jgi:cobalt-zinc-cadmium efflux system outer membrane protein
MTFRTSVLATLCTVVLGAPVRAQEPQSWTLQRLLAHAREHEPQLDAARLTALAVQEDVRQAALRANPRVTLERRQEFGGMDRQSTAMAELPLEWGRRGARVTTARAELKVAAAGAADRERLIEYGIHTAHHTYLAALRRVAVLEELLAQARRTRSLLEERVNAGATPRLERDQAAIEASRVEAAHRAAQGDADAAAIELQLAAGLPPSPSFTVSETLETLVPWADIDLTLAAPASASPIDARPDVVRSEAMVGVETARGDQQRAEGRLDLSVIGGYMRMTSGFPQKGLDDRGAPAPIQGTFDNAVVGVMIDVPLFNRNQGAIASAEFRATAARREADARRLAAAAEASAAHRRLRAAAGAARLFNREMRDLARHNVDVVREAYALGRNTLLDVLTEQKRYLDVEMAYTEALMTVLDAHAAWVAATWRQQ